MLRSDSDNDIPELPILLRNIEYLKNLKNERNDINNLHSILIQRLGAIPIFTTRVHTDKYISRAVIVENESEVQNESRISYNPIPNDYYGRADYPGKSVFYGSLRSAAIDHSRLTNLFEISELYRNRQNIGENADLLLVVGNWRIKKQMELAECVFDPRCLEVDQYCRDAFNNQMKNIRDNDPNNAEKIEIIMKFFSEEYANRYEEYDDRNYQISAGFMKHLEYSPFGGVTFQSVRTAYLGTNVALFPCAVDEYLNLEHAGMFKVRKRGNQSVIENYKIATDLGINNSNFQWEDYNPEGFYGNPE